MKNLLKIIIPIIITIIIGIGIVLIFLINNQNKKDNNLSKTIENYEYEEIYGGTKKIEKVTSRNDFYIVEKCVQKYIGYVQKSDTEKVYGCMDGEYLKQKQIAKTNIENEIKKLKVGEFTALKMYEYDDTQTVSEYFVYGLLNNEDYYITVKIDYDNETFSVLPNFYIDENYIKNNNGIRIVEIK